MAIQFCCTQCGQPIEVDDEHAGKTAACPYCRHMISVPPQSTYSAEAGVAARPLGGTGAAGPSPFSVEIGATSAIAIDPLVAERQRRARKFGDYAMVITALALIVFVAALVGVVSVMLRELGTVSTASPSAEQIEQVQRVMTKHAWIPMASFASLLLTVIGLSLGIVSLTQTARGNWRGILSVVLCGLFLLCVCTAQLLSFALAGKPPVG